MIQNKIKNRILYPDALRIVTIFALVFLHVAANEWNTLEANTYEWQVLNFYDSLVRWCVPIFVMVSGIFLLDFTRYSDDIVENYKRIFNKNIKKILLTLVVWSVFYSFVAAYAENESFSELSKFYLYLKNMFFSPTYYHLWFLYMIIGLYLLAPLLQILVKNLTQENFKFALIILVVFGSGVRFLNEFLKYFFDSELFFPSSEFGGYMVYFLAGYYFNKYEISAQSKRQIYILALISVIITCVLTSLFSVYGTKNLYFYNNLNLTSLLAGFAVFLFFKERFKNIKISPNLSKKVVNLGSLALGIYLIHPFVILIFTINGINTTSFEPLFSVPILAIVYFLISVAITFILQKIPFLSKVV